jgi:FMN phosphatase YigB (HAD superfamily)
MTYAGLILDFGGVDDKGLLAKALADLKPRPEVIDLTRRARARGVRVAALSNSWGTGSFDPYAGWGMDEMFDAVVISDQVGLRKPDPEIFSSRAPLRRSPRSSG